MNLSVAKKMDRVFYEHAHTHAHAIIRTRTYDTMYGDIANIWYVRSVYMNNQALMMDYKIITRSIKLKKKM